MRGEEAGSHSHSHLVYFQRSAFPSHFLSLDLSPHGSERGQAAPRAISLSPAAPSFSPAPSTSFCTLKSLLLSEREGCPLGSCIPGLSPPSREARLPWKALHTQGCLAETEQPAGSSLVPDLQHAVGKPCQGLDFPLRWLQMAKSLQSNACATASTTAVSNGFGNPCKGCTWVEVQAWHGMVWHNTVPALPLLPLSGSPAPDPPPEPPHTTSAPLCFPFPPSLLSRPC